LDSGYVQKLWIFEPAYCMKDLEFMNNILSGTKYRVRLRAIRGLSD
jgi:hypothetical protein